MEALGLQDVTLVGNDTGGAICQFLLDEDSSRVGRVVLTNCDAFTNFPPAPFGQLFKAFRKPTAIRALMAPMRATAVRHSPAGFGLLVREPLDAEQTRAWVQPCLERRGDPRGRRALCAEGRPDRSRRGVGPSGELRRARRCWSGARRTASSSSTDARRLRDAFASARLVEIEDGRTFVPHDFPQRLAGEIAAFQGA